MKMCFVVLIAFGIASLVTSQLRGADLDFEKQRLQGTWQSVSFEAVGVPKNSRKVTLAVEGDRVRMTVDADKHEFTYELDVDSEPKRLDFVRIENGVVVFRNCGLYVLQDDTLTICHGGPARPTKLALRAVANSLDSLIVLKRKR